jgi:recombination protein RecR
MPNRTPPPIHDVAAEFDMLPGVGPRAALRYAYWLLSQPKDRILRFADALRRLSDSVVRCTSCGIWSEASPCAICMDGSRDPAKLCVVANPQDVRVIEDSGVFRGRYHVLGGLIDPISGRTPDQLWIEPLFRRIADPSSMITEVILALDPDVAGDTTSLYLKREITRRVPNHVRVTRLARGLPNGAQLEYADELTIAEALEHRREE